MAKLIVKWRYIQPGTPKHCSRHVKYIATREGVEKCDDSWKLKPATREQERLIKDLLKDFPTANKTHEYADFLKEKNKYNASAFISKTIDENIDIIGKKENYVEYIAKRPRVEKQGKHGLFTQLDEPIDLNAVAKNIAEHDGTVWTTVLSLRREDAERLGYNNAKAWRDLLRSKHDVLAEAMGIDIKDLRWYAAFHNEGNHPHVHIVSYSVGKTPYMTEEGLERMKSKYANAIFCDDLYKTYVEQTKRRDELRAVGKERIREIVKAINNGGYDNPRVEALLVKLKEELKDYKGKMLYGYLPKGAKNLVDGIVDEMASDSRIKELYELWYEQKDEIVRTYKDTTPERLPLSKNDDFKSIKNAVLKELANIQGDTPNKDEKHGQPKQKEKAEKSIEYFETAAGLGNAYAQYQLGKIYLYGNGVEKNYEKAIEYLKASSDNGNQYVQRLLQTIESNRNYSVGLGSLRLFRYLGNMLQNTIDDERKGKIGLIDRKQRKDINEKKQAHGLKYE